MKVTLHFQILSLCMSANLLVVGSAHAKDGGLSAELIGQIQSDCRMDVHTRAMYNSITNNNVKDLALNRDILRRHNEFFSDKVAVKGITNQRSSGRCWLFAGLNSFRPAVIAWPRVELLESEYTEFVTGPERVKRPGDGPGHQRLVIREVLVHIDHQQQAGPVRL